MGSREPRSGGQERTRVARSVRDSCSLVFAASRLSRSHLKRRKIKKTLWDQSKGKIDVYLLCSNTVHISTDVRFCHDPLSHLAIDASSCMKVKMNDCVKNVNINRMCRSIIIFLIA